MAPIFETIMNKNSSSLSNPSSQSSSSSSSFIVRNHAIGNNPCFPYDACIITHLGDDVDILLWEQSMNCGREVLPLQVFTTIAAYHMKKQPTVIYLLSGGPTWTKSFCEQLYANSSSSSEGRDDGSSDGSSSSRSSGSGSNSLRDSRRINQLRNLSDLEINLLQNDMRTNANLSHHGFLHQFRFLHDDNDDSYLAERFSNSAPMAQVSYEVIIKMMLLLMIIMMVMVVAMMMMMMMMMLMVSVNKFLMLAFFTSL
jgi:hypothetical protein